MNQVRISETPFSWLYSHLNYHDIFLIFAVRIWVKCLSSQHNLLIVSQACKTYPACCVRILADANGRLIVQPERSGQRGRETELREEVPVPDAVRTSC